jgi:hypothetical protein
MRLAIMQPYFFPYIGYFQLMKAVDEFVVYDNIEFTKKGWIHRNRILVNGQDSFVTVPLKKDSDYLDVKDRQLAESWIVERRRMLNRINAAYRKAPMFDSAYPVIERCILFESGNLFEFLWHSLDLTKAYLGIRTPLLISSTIPIDHSLRSSQKVIALCRARRADVYLNPIGGVQLYKKEDFEKEGIDLHFLRSAPVEYKQFQGDFVPWLSIIDVMMFNPLEQITKMLESCFLE